MTNFASLSLSLVIKLENLVNKKSKKDDNAGIEVAAYLFILIKLSESSQVVKVEMPFNLSSHSDFH